MAVPDYKPGGSTAPAVLPVTQINDVTMQIPASEGSAPSEQSSVQPQDGSSEKTRATWSGKVEFLLYAVGFAVGLGNVWRFPYLCYKNGGGAFLVPYVLMLVVLGLPLFFLELAFGQYASLGSLTIWRICPLFKGLGYAMLVINVIVSVYYNVMIGYTLFYFFASFQSPLPWTHCGNWWNRNCRESRVHDNITVSERSLNSSETVIYDNMTMVQEFHNLTNGKSPAQEYWEYRVLGVEDDTDISNVGAVRWHVTLCLLLAWIVVYLCIIKGIKSSGKVVYFTSTFPYLILSILFIRGVTLEGAGEGIKYYLYPQFEKMAHVEVWKDAAIQILYSLGPGFGSLLTMGSYNKFHNNCEKDAIIVAVINCGTSLFAGFVIFSVLGHMAHDAGVGVGDVVDKGPGLAFIAYPEGLALMPAAPFWSLLFFFMLFILGLDSQFAGMEGIITGLTDEFPILYRHKLASTTVICGLLFLLGLPCVTMGGMYVIELLDKFSTSFPLLFTVFLEVIVINWIYGFHRFAEDIQTMIGHKPNYYWLGCWVVVSPVVVVFILVFSCIQYNGIEFQGYQYPPWAEGIGWLLSLASILMIPSWMIVRVAQCIGSCQNLSWIIRGPKPLSSMNLKSLVTPTHEWGPALQDHRESRDTDTYGRMTEEIGPSEPERSSREGVRILTDAAAYSPDSYI